MSCQRRLFQIARAAILQVLTDPALSAQVVVERAGMSLLERGDLPEELLKQRATFVTLTLGGRLRGCMGMLEACRPLAEDVASNAVAAAFEDPRFPPVSLDEFGLLDISISILSPPEEVEFQSEADLLGQLRPGVDGVILQEGLGRGTFLPSVWTELPDRRQFLDHLKRKAGLPTSYWSETVRIFRYTAELLCENER